LYRRPQGMYTQRTTMQPDREKNSNLMRYQTKTKTKKRNKQEDCIYRVSAQGIYCFLFKGVNQNIKKTKITSATVSRYLVNHQH